MGAFWPALSFAGMWRHRLCCSSIEAFFSALIFFGGRDGQRMSRTAIAKPLLALGTGAWALVGCAGEGVGVKARVDVDSTCTEGDGAHSMTLTEVCEACRSS